MNAPGCRQLRRFFEAQKQPKSRAQDTFLPEALSYRAVDVIASGSRIEF